VQLELWTGTLPESAHTFSAVPIFFEALDSASLVQSFEPAQTSTFFNHSGGRLECYSVGQLKSVLNAAAPEPLRAGHGDRLCVFNAKAAGRSTCASSLNEGNSVDQAIV
jgi:hypothetical protein